MDKEFVKRYKEDLAAFQKAQKNISDLKPRKEALEKEVTDLKEKLTQAETAKQRSLQGFALGEGLQSDVEKAKKVVVQLRETLEDTGSMLAAVEEKIDSLEGEINSPSGLKNKIQEGKIRLYRLIYLELAEDLRTVGKKLAKSYSAYRWSGGIAAFHDGYFLNELFNQTEPSLEEQRQYISEIDREYGLL